MLGGEIGVFTDDDGSEENEVSFSELKESTTTRFEEKRVLANSQNRTVKANYLNFWLISLAECTDIESIHLKLEEYEIQYPKATEST